MHVVAYTTVIQRFQPHSHVLRPTTAKIATMENNTHRWCMGGQRMRQQMMRRAAVLYYETRPDQSVYRTLRSAMNVLYRTDCRASKQYSMVSKQYRLLPILNIPLKLELDRQRENALTLHATYTGSDILYIWIIPLRCYKFKAA